MVCWGLVGCISIATSCGGVRSAPMVVGYGRSARNDGLCCSMDAPLRSARQSWIVSNVSSGVVLMEHHALCSSFLTGPMRRSWSLYTQGDLAAFVPSFCCILHCKFCGLVISVEQNSYALSCWSKCWGGCKKNVCQLLSIYPLWLAWCGVSRPIVVLVWIFTWIILLGKLFVNKIEKKYFFLNVFEKKTNKNLA